MRWKEEAMNHIYEQPQFGENWFTYPNLYSGFVRFLPENSTIVEVGCWKGKSVSYLAVEVINSGKKISIHAVDTWKGSVNEVYHQSNSDVMNDTLYQLFLSNIEPVKQVITPIRMASVDAAKTYSDESLDVVFIDAGHSYEEVKEDILAWFPKVKRGGYIAGHDYSWCDGVKQAVDEIIKDISVSEGCWYHKKI
jgi:hypothetical protein